MKVTTNLPAGRSAEPGDLVQSKAEGEVGICYPAFSRVLVLWLRPVPHYAGLDDQEYTVLPKGTTVTLTQEAT